MTYITLASTSFYKILMLSQLIQKYTTKCNTYK